MEKIILRLFVMILSLSVLSGCKSIPDNTAAIPSDFKIIYDDPSFFIDAPAQAKEGETVLKLCAEEHILQVVSMILFLSRLIFTEFMSDLLQTEQS